jgi:hypothetical protein
VKYFITTFLALSSTLCFAQDTPTSASLFPQSNAAALPILTAEPEVLLQEATGVIIGEETTLLETNNSDLDSSDTEPVAGSKHDGTEAVDLDAVFDSNVATPQPDRSGFLRGINLDLYERDMKLFDGFRPGNTDQVGRWVRLDYLIAWRRGTRVPALATTSTAGTSLEF